MRDLKNNLAVIQALAPIVIAATTTTPSIDLLDFNSAMAVVNTGAIVGSGNFTAKLQESDDGTTFTDVAAADQHGTFPTALAAASVVKVGYRGYKRYVRVVITLNSGTSIAASVLIIKGNAAKKPVA